MMRSPLGDVRKTGLSSGNHNSTLPRPSLAAPYHKSSTLSTFFLTTPLIPVMLLRVGRGEENFMPKYKTIPDLFSAKQAGEKMGMQDAAVRWHARRNQIGFFKFDNGGYEQYFFTREDIKRFMRGEPAIPQFMR